MTTRKQHTVAERLASLSDAFSKSIRGAVEGAELFAIHERNQTYDYGCASQDFMDANMNMSAAWEEVFGKPFLPASDDEPSIWAFDLWNEAWEISRNASFLNGANMDELLTIYESWIDCDGLPHLSTEEMAAEDITDTQREFLKRWEKAYDTANA